MKKIPYKIYLEESELPKQWYNVRADMKNKPAPILNPQTLKPITFEELRPVFCDELVKMCIRDSLLYSHIIIIALNVSLSCTVSKRGYYRLNPYQG